MLLKIQFEKDEHEQFLCYGCLLVKRKANSVGRQIGERIKKEEAGRNEESETRDG